MADDLFYADNKKAAAEYLKKNPGDTYQESVGWNNSQDQFTQHWQAAQQQGLVKIACQWLLDT